LPVRVVRVLTERRETQELPGRWGAAEAAAQAVEAAEQV